MKSCLWAPDIVQSYLSFERRAWYAPLPRYPRDPYKALKDDRNAGPIWLENWGKKQASHWIPRATKGSSTSSTKS